MPSMFAHISNLTLKFFLGLMLSITFVLYLKYDPIVNGDKRASNAADVSPTSDVTHQLIMSHVGDISAA